MTALRIIGLCVLAAVLYGVAHDQVTARVCVEYFTIGHPRILATESPTVLGLAWGVIATWWVGLVLGAPLAFAVYARSLAATHWSFSGSAHRHPADMHGWRVLDLRRRRIRVGKQSDRGVG